MAFSSRRGRPRAITGVPDQGTPELRAKRRHGVTQEPIDRCFEQGLIHAAQHRAGLHLRWLYTVRYGAPSITTHYGERAPGGNTVATEEWRTAREDEYRQAIQLLHAHRRYEPVMRFSVYNELPAFMQPTLQRRAWEYPLLAERLQQLQFELSEGLTLLATHWNYSPKGTDATTPHL